MTDERPALLKVCRCMGKYWISSDVVDGLNIAGDSLIDCMDSATKAAEILIRLNKQNVNEKIPERT